MQVLVAGAGPTGLVLALWLSRRGVAVKIVDKAKGPGETSRAMAVQARTLEFYRQLGFADEVVAHGLKMQKIQAFEGDKPIATFDFSDLGEGISPYPFVLSFPQDEHERLLGKKLAESGVEVEWNTEVVELQPREDGSKVKLRRSDQVVEANFSYVCGCDGAHSVVRQQLGIGFPGGTYDLVFFVADVQAKGQVSEDGFKGHIGEQSFLLVLPIRTTGRFRLIGTIPSDQLKNESVTFEDIRSEVERLGHIQVEKVEWFSRYKVHHRVAETFRKGPAFLCGDAGHIHSPVGGQGMNTGIGDAVNLAWKIAEVSKGADPSLLDSYEPERIAFAHALVNSTDRIFTAVTGGGVTAFLFREVFIRHIAPFALGFSPTKHALFSTLSQTRIDYRKSPLSDGVAGEVHAGDRLPWVGNNFDPLASLEWQLHIYGSGNAVEGVPTHLFPWTEDAEKAGLKQDACYLVRPDGYIALADAKLDRDRIQTYLKTARGMG